MSDSSDDQDQNPFEEIKSFFSPSEWTQMSSYEKKTYRNIFENYHAMQKAGLSAKAPAFMQPKNAKVATSQLKRRSRSKRQSDSEEEWTPSYECRAKTRTSSRSKSKSVRCVSGSRSSKNPKKEKPKDDVDLKAPVAAAAPSRYPKRAGCVRSYEEGALLDDDDFLYCDDCEREYEGDCPEHGELLVIQDTEVPMGEPDRASRTVPKELAILPSKIQGAGLGVWARQHIPRRVRFGPYEGDFRPLHQDSGYGWEIKREGKPVHCVDAVDVRTSNWMRYVNCARFEAECYAHAYQYKGSLYYRTVREVPAHEELLVWYGDSYAKDLGIDPKGFKSTPENPLLINGRFPCGTCALSFCSPLFLQKHRSSGACSGLRSSLTIRSTKEEPEDNAEPRIIKCDGCSLAFTSVQFLEKHYRWCSGRRDRRAPEGDSASERQPAEPPGGEQPRQEDTADRGPSGDMPAAGEAQGRKHACDTCGKRFAESGHLHTHVRTHTGDKPYACDTCGKRFADTSALHRHVRTHTGDKPYACDTCGRRFAQSSVLHRHVRTHTGDKPYACDTCGKRFARSFALHTHVRTHTGDKPYACDTCGKRFAESGHLHTHVRTHTGDKPYACDTCGKRFARSFALHTHVRTHTGDKPYACDTCGKKFSDYSHLLCHTKTHKDSINQPNETVERKVLITINEA